MLSIRTVSVGFVQSLYLSFLAGDSCPSPHSPMLCSGDAVSSGLKSRKITELSANHDQIITL